MVFLSLCALKTHMRFPLLHCVGPHFKQLNQPRVCHQLNYLLVVMFQDLLILAIISTQSLVRPCHGICNLLNQGETLRHSFLSFQMHQPSNLKPPHCQDWRSGMLHKNPKSSQNIPSCGDKPFGQQGTRSCSSKSQPVIEHLFCCNLKPTGLIIEVKFANENLPSKKTQYKQIVEMPKPTRIQKSSKVNLLLKVS